MRDDGPRALVEGLDGAVARAARALDAHARGAADAQDALCARVDRCADALEALVDAMPTSASEAHAKRLRSLRQRIDGLGASARDLRDRARALHDDARASRRADSSALAGARGRRVTAARRGVSRWVTARARDRCNGVLYRWLGDARRARVERRATKTDRRSGPSRAWPP